MGERSGGSSAPTDAKVRAHVLSLLDGRSAHVDFDRAVEGISPADRGRRPEGMPHSPWEILEHLRIAQEDILEFGRSADWVSPEWPAGYWPPSPQPPDPASPSDRTAWDRSVRAFRDDLATMKEIISDPAGDLYAPFPWGDGQTLLRQALLLADHNAYHLGELVAVRRALGAWPA